MIFVKCLNRQKQIPVNEPGDVKLWYGEEDNKTPLGVSVHSATGEDYEIPFSSVGFIVDTHRASRPREESGLD